MLGGSDILPGGNQIFIIVGEGKIIPYLIKNVINNWNNLMRLIPYCLP